MRRSHPPDRCDRGRITTVWSRARAGSPKDVKPWTAAARKRAARLKRAIGPVALAAAAAAVAWLVARHVLAHKSPFFAPVAALIVLTASRGRRVRQGVELVIGVALGIGVADVLSDAIGRGIPQLALVVALAMLAATLLDAGGAVVSEAAVSAVLVVTVEPTTTGFPPVRFVDAVVGGAIALIASQLLFPTNPVRIAERATRPMIKGLAATLDAVAAALEAGDLHAAERALADARRIGDDWETFQRALDIGSEAARYAPPRRRQRDRFNVYQDVGLPLDLLVHDIQVLARAAVRSLTIGDTVPDQLPPVLHDLAHATARIAGELGEADGAATHDVALDATRAATALAPDPNISLSLLVGHIQATAADLLRAIGLDRQPAHEAIGQAAAQAQPTL